MAFSQKELVNELIRGGYLKTPTIIEAFKNIDRADFVLEEYKKEAYGNYPLPIGFGQTISQPLTVAFMLELLQPISGQKILDIGSGSGWQTAILAYIVSQDGIQKSKGNPPTGGQNSGKVFAIERVPELCEFGKNNVSKYNFVKKGIVKFYCQDGSSGLLEEALFDGIIAAASAKELPISWKKQVKIGGRIVAPIGNSIWLFIKKSKNEFESFEYPGFVFVPLV